MTGIAADATLVLQAAILLAVLEGLRRRNVPAVVNGLVALGATGLPAALQVALDAFAGLDLVIVPELPLWIAVAGLVHAVGMLGLYDTLWWWDHLAHAISAALVTALVYAAVLVAVRGGAGPTDATVVVGLTLGLLLLVAVFWELIEELARHVAETYEMGPLLVVYGPFDWLFDLAFNLVGAGLVIALDLRVFVPVFGPFPDGTGQLLLGVGGTALALDVLLALALARWRDDWP